MVFAMIIKLGKVKNILNIGAKISEKQLVIARFIYSGEDDITICSFYQLFLILMRLDILQREIVNNMNLEIHWTVVIQR